MKEVINMSILELLIITITALMFALKYGETTTLGVISIISLICIVPYLLLKTIINKETK